MLWPRTMRGLWSFEPWEEMRRLQRQMNRLFTDVWPGATRRAYPPVNLWAGRDSAVVTVELPGLDPKALDISVVGDTLTLKGSREADELKEGQAFTRQERAVGDFHRQIKMPFRVEPDNVEATYAKGILRISLPRLEADRPKQIAVKPKA